MSTKPLETTLAVARFCVIVSSAAAGVISLGEYIRDRSKRHTQKEPSNTQEDWAHLPDSVLRQVFAQLSMPESWIARQVSEAWAGQARQVACFDLEIQADSTSIVRKVQALCNQRLQQKLPGVHTTFCLTEPLRLRSLSCSLLQFWDKTADCSHYKVDVSLLLDSAPGTSTAFLATEIAHTASRLFTQHGIAISIAIQSATGAARAAPPAVLRALAPFLSGIHMYSAPPQHTCSDHHIYEAACSAFSAAHMAALQHCNASFTALCVSDRRSSLVLASDAIAGNMAHIAQLTNLTKLHLGLCDLQQAADFQQLTQLTKLQDLGLQSYRASASCEAILFSNRHCLRKVNLAARSWTVATYRALQQLPCLQALVIRLRSFSVTQARTLAGIRANHFTLDVRDVRRIQDDALLAVSTVAPMVQIQELMLWDMDSVSCRDLRALPFLKTLTVVNSPLLTGTCFCVHANVTELNFVNCPRVSENGLRHMLSAAFPKLKSLNFQRSSNQFGNHGDFDAAALQVLSCGVNLEVIDLRGLTGLTHQGVDKLKRAIEEEQNEGRAEPLVTLHLPVGSTQIGQGQPFGVVYDSLYIPPFCVVGEQGSALIVCKRDSHEKLVWGVGSVVFSACLFIYELQVMAKKDKEQDEATVSFGFV